MGDQGSVPGRCLGESTQRSCTHHEPNSIKEMIRFTMGLAFNKVIGGCPPPAMLHERVQRGYT